MIKNYNQLMCLFAIAICLFGCKTSEKEEKTAIQMLPAPDEISTFDVGNNTSVTQTLDPDNKLAEISSDYRLAPGDIIELYSLDTPEVARKYVLGPDGKITVPGIGVLSLEKLTREEAAKKISKKLSLDYIDPNVDVLVIEYNGNEIYVLGALLRTGIFSFKGRPTLLSAISRAEGFQPNADLRSCQVLRGRGTIINVDIS
jgi:protein involved in polysaccharide export with SLBB domain